MTKIEDPEVISLNEFLKKNNYLIMNLGVFAALTAHFKNTFPDVAGLSFILMLIVGYELFVNSPEDNISSNTLNIFKFVLLSLLLFISLHILQGEGEQYGIGRLFFGFVAGAIVYDRITKIKAYDMCLNWYSTKNLGFRKEIRLLLLLIVFGCIFIIAKYLRIINLDKRSSDIVVGFLLAFIIIPYFKST